MVLGLDPASKSPSKTMSRDTLWKLGAGSAGLAVALGAFGAHGLQKRVSSTNLLEIWKTASQYHLAHSIGMIIAAGANGGGDVVGKPGGGLAVAPLAAKFMGVGVVLFSGSLYGYVLTEQRKLAAVAPVGGLAFIAGWIALALRK